MINSRIMSKTKNNTMRRAVIFCNSDAYANSVKPKELERYLSKSGYRVDLFETAAIGRMSHVGIGRVLPKLNLMCFTLFMYEALNTIVQHEIVARLKSRIISYVTPKIIILRGKVIYKVLSGQKIDVLICENSMDSGFLLNERIAAVQVLDLPAPLAEELKYSSSLTHDGYERLKKLEVELYGRADYLSFHWHTYSDYVKKTKYSGSNFIDLNYGTELKAKRARFAKSPKIIFLGFLGGYWVNLALLEKLCRAYPHIDIYGGPPPTGYLAKHYRGYADNLDILSEYQFGLITISNDPLRKNSFSSKHLEYISYGLPVLTPDWRYDAKLNESSIYYNESDFLTKLKEYNEEMTWRNKSEAAIKLAGELTWDTALSNLGGVIDGAK